MMSRVVVLLTSGLLCVSAWADEAPADAAPQQPVKVHQELYEQHRGAVPSLLRTDWDALLPPKGASAAPPPARTFKKIAYGYLPYWSDTNDVPWEHLTHVSYFSVEISADGSLGSDHGWTAKGANLVSLGHSHGVQVTLTATLFNDTQIGALLGSATARQNAINNLLARVQAAGGDGVNIDFEFVPKTSKASFVTFINDLTTAFHAAIPGSHVSLATPPVDWNGAYDYDLLAEGSDGMMIMGYGYHWGGGNPGPGAPIDYGTTWSSKSLRWTIGDYKQWGKVENRHKFVLGLPLYGRTWQTTSVNVPGVRKAGTTGSAKVMSSCDTFFVQRGKKWDTESQSPYQTYVDGGQAYQTFCEDRDSMAAKFDLIMSEDVGGVMYWALGYVPVTHGVWQDADARFLDDAAPVNQPPVATITAPATSVVGETLTLDGSASVDPDGDALTYQWTVVSGPALSLVGTNQAVAHAVPMQAETYRFALEVSDGTAVHTAEVDVEILEAGTGGAAGAGPGGSGGGAGGSTGGTAGTGGAAGDGGGGAGGGASGGTNGAAGDGGSGGEHHVVVGTPPEGKQPVPGGCTTTGSAPDPLWLAALALVLARRRNR